MKVIEVAHLFDMNCGKLADTLGYTKQGLVNIIEKNLGTPNSKRRFKNSLQALGVVNQKMLERDIANAKARAEARLEAIRQLEERD